MPSVCKTWLAIAPRLAKRLKFLPHSSHYELGSLDTMQVTEKYNDDLRHVRPIAETSDFFQN